MNDLVKSAGPLFSIVVPTYNRAHTLLRAINSVLHQSFTDFELIIVDDGSSDSTGELVKSIHDARVQYLFQANRGVSAARNLGAEKATGQFLTFLDSDDEALPQWLEHLVQAFQSDKIGVVCCGMYVVSPEALHQLVLPRNLGPAFEHQHGLFIPGTFALRRTIFKAVGGYIEELAYSENTELYLRLIAYSSQAGYTWATLNIPLVTYYNQPFGNSRSINKLSKLLASSEYFLRHHKEELGKDPNVLGAYIATSGVRAAKLGQYKKAQQYFRSAIAVSPLDWHHYFRLLLALLPPLGRKVWLRHYSNSS